jgi:hypothetical protein
MPRALFDSVSVFSATKAVERQKLGEKVTTCLQGHADYDVVEMVVRQSSDSEFHCLTIILFSRSPGRVPVPDARYGPRTRRAVR